MWVKPEDQKIVGELFRTVREKADITQEQLAERLGKRQSFVSGYEAGQRRIDVLEFLLLAGALETDPLSLFKSLLAKKKKTDAQNSGARKPASRLRLYRKVHFS